jgi:hypothetical protein
VLEVQAAVPAVVLALQQHKVLQAQVTEEIIRTHLL